MQTTVIRIIIVVIVIRS